MNEPLRRAMTDAGMGEHDIADRLDVDVKTVRRWLAGRTPYPRHRRAMTALLGVNEADLWPRPARPRLHAAAQTSEVIAMYPHRWAVPRTVWYHLFAGAHREIGILVYAGLFLAEDTGLVRLLAEKARSDVTVRIMLGDPDSPHIRERGENEGVGDSLAAKISNSLVLYQPLYNVAGVEFRLHSTVLYNSIYRADDCLMINPHAYGIAAARAPVLHVRQTESGDMASTYLNSFERVWDTAVPLA
ncbi:XRE family transcriptional regulator [Actinomadura craniellae]|uniref:XRE family transcriptional regulator n=1 Tax=Actinomadura craniellae TaxID=2231787 RepID=A0A365HCK6_9ACTN|nr:XRE family transcriptional regulator [Actinomadura craniellae]RAY16738.1 XRE family transcriptional regulator [Actinomadura craniellae]